MLIRRVHSERYGTFERREVSYVNVPSSREDPGRADVERHENSGSTISRLAGSSHFFASLEDDVLRPDPTHLRVHASEEVLTDPLDPPGSADYRWT